MVAVAGEVDLVVGKVSGLLVATRYDLLGVALSHETGNGGKTLAILV
jgi:hypothetical protein